MQLGRLTLTILAMATQLAVAGPQAFDSCQSHCAIGFDDANIPSLFCTCPKGPRTVFRTLESFPENFSHNQALQQMRLHGQDASSIALVAGNSCQINVDRYRLRPRSEESIKQFLNNESPNVCECVAQRVHYPVLRECRHSLANEATCSFQLVTSSNNRRPLRDPTLEDYQSCLVQRITNPPAAPTCEAAACSAPPVCRADTELVNLASADACCPKYNCREIRRGAQPDLGGSSSAQ